MLLKYMNLLSLPQAGDRITPQYFGDRTEIRANMTGQTNTGVLLALGPGHEDVPTSRENELVQEAQELCEALSRMAYRGSLKHRIMELEDENNQLTLRITKARLQLKEMHAYRRQLLEQIEEMCNLDLSDSQPAQ